MLTAPKQQELSVQLLQSIVEIANASIDPTIDKRSLFKIMLLKLLQLTGSEYGFIGEVLYTDAIPRLKTYSITDISWDEATAALYKKHEATGMVFTNLNTLFGYTLRTGEMVISNNPATDDRRGGLPHGHPPLNHYLGIPIKGEENKLIGMMGLGNKKGGYHEDDFKFLEPLISIASTLITADRIREDKEHFSGRMQLYRNIIDSYAIVAITDGKGAITYANDLFCEISKYSSEELRGQTHALLKSDYHDKGFYSELWSTISNGKSWKGTIKNKAKDGTFYWVETFIVPFVDQIGKPYEFFSISNDVTKIKEQEIELQNVFNLSVDVLCICNMEGYLTRVSSSFTKLTGYTEAELTSRKFVEFIFAEDLQKTLDEFHSISNGALTIDFDTRWVCKNGETVRLRWVAALNQQNKLIYASASDITKKVEAEEKLMASKIEMEKAKAKDIFLANMSHEIRTPLNAIIGFTDLLSETSLDKNQRNHIQIIQSALDNLNVIINDILDISKLESGKIELEKRIFNLDFVMRQLVNIHQGKADSKHIRLMYTKDSDLPVNLIGDDLRLSQILINLISNALKFTSKGYVELKAEKKAVKTNKVSILFSVRDTGIGIDENKLQLIFERFTQAEGYTTRVFGGTGLGLNIVRSLVELHGGKIDVKSTPGVGSVFSFEIEYDIPVDESSDTLTKFKKSNNQTGNIKVRDHVSVLLVDDNPHNQLLAKTYLERNGCKVHIVENGELALEHLKNSKHDLIVMDVQMPILDGIEATKQIRNNLKLDTPIIGCSAHALSSERKKCLNAGMNNYITKPYSESDIVDAVWNLIQHREELQINTDTLDATDENALEIFKEWEFNYGRETMMKLLNLLRKLIPETIQTIESSRSTDDFLSIATASHKICGSLGSLNLNQGYMVAQQLERVAKNKDQQEVELLSGKLIEYLKELMNETSEL